MITQKSYSTIMFLYIYIFGILKRKVNRVKWVFLEFEESRTHLQDIVIGPNTTS